MVSGQLEEVGGGDDGSDRFGSMVVVDESVVIEGSSSDVDDIDGIVNLAVCTLGSGVAGGVTLEEESDDVISVIGWVVWEDVVVVVVVDIVVGEYVESIVEVGRIEGEASGWVGFLFTVTVIVVVGDVVVVDGDIIMTSFCDEFLVVVVL